MTLLLLSRRYYEYFVSDTNIIANYDLESEHCMPTLDSGEDCGTLSSPYIGKCNFDGAGNALSALLGSLQKRTTDQTVLSKNLHSFDQRPYIPSPHSSIGDTGYIYLPTSCALGDACRLHVALHGCDQALSMIGPQFAELAGYNQWAETNNVIVLYPYVEVSSSLPTNPKGCWDWWAYTDYRYGTKEGVQMRFVMSLVRALGGEV